MTATAGASTPSPDAVGDDRPCLACGYNLRGLDPAGVCPECGVPVARSLQGNLLKFSGRDYLAGLHRGVFLIQAGIVIQFVASVGATLGGMILGAGGAWGRPAGFFTSVALLGFVSSVASIMGWWLLSAPDPAFVGAESGTNARKVVRATVLVAAVCAAVSNASAFGILPRFNPQTLGTTGTTPLMFVSLLAVLANLSAWVVWFFAAMRYLRWLAPRLPNAKAHRRAGTMMWLGPVVSVLGLPLCGLGPLIALILYYNLLEWFRKDLRMIRAEQAAVPA